MALIEKGSQWIRKGSCYPEGVVTVIRLSENRNFLQFARIGYCRVYRATTEQFAKQFRPVTPEELAAVRQPELAYFDFDDTPLILGFTYGQRWNGWGVPLLEKESYRAWLEAVNDRQDPECTYMYFKGDKLFVHDPHVDEPDDQEIPEELLVYGGQTYRVHDVSNGWCWNQYDMDENPVEIFGDEFPVVFVPKGLEEEHQKYVNGQ